MNFFLKKLKNERLLMATVGGQVWPWSGLLDLAAWPFKVPDPVS